MVKKTNIDEAAAAFLDLWQRQVTLSSQRPEDSVKALFNKAEGISDYLKGQVDKESPEDV
ncbi:hypothetical protein GUA87_02490 [Sneathiella sp. P13V-1]|uniref:hypothetical protein n=1 Tax=Sneathiella sp. P13V-1 TaxID=2697366 RepID=UPI00187BA93E|nr:hypothetical protein [Sneathiella sp. P13V-1]MBE7635698.1 hypothetical protein [Sneathiella sp. P13V-1]